MPTPRSQQPSGGLRKLIIPALVIAAIFFLFRGGDETEVETPENETQQETQTVEQKEGSQTTRSEKIGIAFDAPAAWGEIDSENEKALILVFDDACMGSDCANLFVEKFAASDSNFSQVSQLVKTLEKTDEKNGIKFYQDTDKKVVTGNKIFAESLKGTLYAFELSGKNADKEDFDEIKASLREVATSTSLNPPPSLTATPATVVTPAPADTAPTPADGVSPASTTPVTPVATGPTYKFQSCSDLAAYAKESFYADFMSQITKEPAFSDPYTMKLYGRQMITANDIRQGCLSTEGKMFLALVPKGPGTGTTEFHIYKYALDTKALKHAEKKGNWARVPGPGEFGKREGRVIHMASSSKETTCINTASYDYDYIDNIITALETCSACEGVEQKQCEKL